MKTLIVDERFCFDDETLGIKDEPFVDGADDILKKAVDLAEVGYPFKLVFSDKHFKGAFAAKKIRNRDGGAEYHTPLGDGWLCPCLMKYFPEPPAELYFKVEGVSE